MKRRGFPITGSIIVAAGVALGLAALAADTGSPWQNRTFPEFPARARRHITPAEPGSALAWKNLPQIPMQPEAGPPPIAPRTRSSFMATWQRVSAASGYWLDVSTDASFSTYVNGYHNLDVGDVTGRVVTGLSQGTTYYYRVRAYDAAGTTSESSTVTTATTTASIGLIIQATFDSSITTRSNAATIEATINQAIAIYESLFSDPITIQILFRYSTTQPNGSPIPNGAISESDFVGYAIPWSTFINALKADAKTQNDFTANTTLPTTALTTNIIPSSANGRAVGLNTPPAMWEDGTVGGGQYDGIVTLNAAVPLQFTRPTSSTNYDAQRATEHEMDEILGLGSRLGTSDTDLHPQDLFSWSSAGVRNLTVSGTRYFSINGGTTNIVNFNQNAPGDLGDWLSTACPQAHPYVQNAFSCKGQYSDVATTSPEGVNLDVIGYDLLNATVVIADTTRRGMVFDFAGQNLYISTSTGLIKTFNLSTSKFGKTYNLGGSLNGIDIARDNSFILAAQNNYSGSQGTFQRVNLSTGAITNINYTLLTSGEAGAWDVGIASNGLAFVTTQIDGSGWTPLRQINLSTNAITVRTDDPGSLGNGSVSAPTKIQRSADGTRLLFMEGDISNGPVFTYSGLTNTFGPSLKTTASGDSSSGAVNRNGSLVGLRVPGTGCFLRAAPNFTFVQSFNAINNGVAFDAIRDIFYGITSATDEIIAYSTTSYAELFRLSIGEDIGPYTYEFGTGTLVASANGRWLALETDSGIRLFQVRSVVTNAATNVASFSATLNGAVDPNGLTTSVYFQYGTTATYGSKTASQSFSGNTYQNVTANISGLTASTKYHFRIVATNSAATVYGADRTFATLSVTGKPVVTTNPATNVASHSATLNGTVDPHGLTTTVYFQYGTTTSYGSTTPSQSKSGSTYQNVSANISGLSASTKYHFRIVATNSSGTTYGADQTFTTLTATGPPIVATNTATLIASFSATLNGTVNPNGLTTTVYFQYGTTTSYGSTTASQSKAGNTNQAVSANISGLNASTTYHFRIVASNSAGTTYGTDRTFTTLSTTGPSVVATNPATLIASFSATLNGSLDPHGLTTAVYFQYGTTTSYGSTTVSQGKTGNTYQAVSANISGLNASTTYHFRIVATNSAGTTYGGDLTFTTLSATGSPVVTTGPATNVASSSATLNGMVDPHGLATTVYFKYGKTTSLGSTTALQSKTGNTYQAVSANISGLSASTTYHYVIEAGNSAGIGYGADKTFTTP